MGRRGRQALYGEKVHLKECFDQLHLFETVECSVSGKTETIQVMRLTLLWRPTADYVLFVLAVTPKGPIILMNSDLTLSAAHTIELYYTCTATHTAPRTNPMPRPTENYNRPASQKYPALHQQNTVPGPV